MNTENNSRFNLVWNDFRQQIKSKKRDPFEVLFEEKTNPNINFP